MTLFVEYNPRWDHWEITQDGGSSAVLNTASNRRMAINLARKRYKRKGEDIAVKGPRMSEFKRV